ncbi:MAG: hypothetical protein M0P02_02275 [Sulfurospirillaceae bacterium]|jgi:hypothetical protein|nr:hypothetical protein [Sulfurospirillaceae bacterium]MCK9545936.1 hypothetical protein [Sulfurospirillaceae bacterium]NLM98397.1 hypothetical protein [Campylobacteraceae bacterium]
MKTVKLTMEENIYKNIMFLLNNLQVKGLKIEEINSANTDDEQNELKAYSNHSANLIEDWKDEDSIWK